jgi:hypothetical protein
MSKLSALCLVMVASTALAGCARHREFRVAHVGYEGSQLAGHNAAPEPTPTAPPPVVASGNGVLAPVAGSIGAVGGNPAPPSGIPPAVLPGSNPGLVQGGTGTAIGVDAGIGVTIGNVASVDLGAGRVIAGASSLVNSGVSTTLGGTGPVGRIAASVVPKVSAGSLLSPGGSGSTRTGSLLNPGGSASTRAGSLLSPGGASGTRAVAGVIAPVRSTAGTVTNVLSGPLGGRCC